MPIIFSDQMNTANLGQHDKLQVYNGIDCCVTHEVHREIKPFLSNNPEAQIVYNFESAMQAPAMEMMVRGFRIDEEVRQTSITELTNTKTRVQWILDQLANACWDKGLNPGSYKQMKEFFYQVLKLPEQYKYEKGVKKLTTNREALEKLWLYFHARPIVNCCLELRDISKKLSVLTTDLDPDGRIRTSYNVAGTETGRWSSSASAFDTGTNLQNITGKLRRIFIADEGYKLGYVDLEQAESRGVGLLVYNTVGDPSYLDACESGDLHTVVTKMVWPQIFEPVPGRNVYDEKDIAEQNFYRDYSYRDMAKRGGHGTNYYGTPPTMARHLKVSVPIMRDFQAAYFKAFPGISQWHRWVAEELQLRQTITTPLGRKRIFFGRPDDDATLREAIAYCPQSIVGDLLNLALWRLWRYNSYIQILAQVHDAVVFQYKEEIEEKALAKTLELMAIPITLGGRTMTIPSEVQVGWNWGKQDPKKKMFEDGNPFGLAKWKGKDERVRLY